MNANPLHILKGMAPLLRAARDCERMSREVSWRQSRLAPAPLAAALRAQSRQEAAHAALFDSALTFVPRGRPCPGPLQRRIGEYGRRLHADLDAGRLVESLIGLQCVFEGLAAVALEPPDGELTRMGERFLPLYALVQHQEAAHQRLGTVWVSRLSPQGGSAVAAAWHGYAALAEGLVEAALEAFDGATEDRDDYSRRTRDKLATLRALGAPVPRRQRPEGSP
jgi:hypothetical protein